MTQYFHGELSGLVIKQKENPDPSTPCIRECQQYLDMPDIQSQSDMSFSSNANRSIWTLRSDSSESFEQLLKHLVYRNTFEPLGPSGQRILTLETTLKCLGENYTYNFPVFTRRLAIDEILHPANIELKGDSTYFLKDDQIKQGIAIFQNLSVWTDSIQREQVDLTDCSINTTPDLADSEQIVAPDEYLQSNNLAKVPTKTGLVLSGREKCFSWIGRYERKERFESQSWQHCNLIKSLRMTARLNSLSKRKTFSWAYTSNFRTEWNREEEYQEYKRQISTVLCFFFLSRFGNSGQLSISSSTNSLHFQTIHSVLWPYIFTCLCWHTGSYLHKWNTHPSKSAVQGIAALQWFSFLSKVQIEQPVRPAAPVASILSNKLYVDNDEIRENFFDIEGQSAGNLSGKQKIQSFLR